MINLKKKNCCEEKIERIERAIQYVNSHCCAFCVLCRIKIYIYIYTKINIKVKQATGIKITTALGC